MNKRHWRKKNWPWKRYFEISLRFFSGMIWRERSKRWKANKYDKDFIKRDELEEPKKRRTYERKRTIVATNKERENNLPSLALYFSLLSQSGCKTLEASESLFCEWLFVYGQGRLCNLSPFNFWAGPRFSDRKPRSGPVPIRSGPDLVMICTKNW